MVMTSGQSVTLVKQDFVNLDKVMQKSENVEGRS